LLSSSPVSAKLAGFCILKQRPLMRRSAEAGKTHRPGAGIEQRR
jgi:hypothetical protein